MLVNLPSNQTGSMEDLKDNLLMSGAEADYGTKGTNANRLTIDTDKSRKNEDGTQYTNVVFRPKAMRVMSPVIKLTVPAELGITRITFEAYDEQDNIIPICGDARIRLSRFLWNTADGEDYGFEADPQNTAITISRSDNVIGGDVYITMYPSVIGPEITSNAKKLSFRFEKANGSYKTISNTLDNALTADKVLNIGTIPSELAFQSDNHPCLFFPETGFNDLIVKIADNSNPALTGLHNTMMAIARTDGLSDKPVSLKTAERDFNAYARMISSRIYSAAYGYRMTLEKEFLEHAVNNIKVFIQSFKTYSTGEFLENSELWISLALAYDWLYDSLDEVTKAQILAALDEFGFDIAENASFHQKKNNINCVCNSALVCAAIATYDDHPEKSEAIIQKSVQSNALGLQGVYYPDGVSPESPSYWDYASNYEAVMFMALEDNFGTDYGLSRSVGFEKGGWYRVFAVGNTGKWFNYGDCNSTGAQTCTALWYYAWKFGYKDLMFRDLELVGQENYSKAIALYMSIACALRMGAFEAEYPQELTYQGGGDAQIVIVRNGWDSESAYLGIKAGKGECNHSHLDEGSFVYEVDGLRWADEFQHPKYSIYNEAKANGDMTNVTKWERFVYNNRRHSTLTVNDRTMKPSAVAPVTELIDSDGRKGGVVNLTPMYYDDLELAEREVVILSDGTLEVFDKIRTRSDKGADIRWTLVTPAAVRLESDHVVLSQEGRSMVMKTSIPVQYKTWSSNPADYSDSPLRKYEPDSSADATMCGFEFSIPAATELELVTTIKRPL